MHRFIKGQSQRLSYAAWLRMVRKICARHGIALEKDWPSATAYKLNLTPSQAVKMHKERSL